MDLRVCLLLVKTCGIFSGFVRDILTFTPVLAYRYFCQLCLFHHRGSFYRKLDDMTHVPHC